MDNAMYMNMYNINQWMFLRCICSQQVNTQASLRNPTLSYIIIAKNNLKENPSFLFT